MFYHLFPIEKTTHDHDGNSYEIEIYKAEEDGHLRGYISCGEINEVVVEITNEVASNMKHYGDNPAEAMIDAIKTEIDNGKFPIHENT